MKEEHPGKKIEKRNSKERRRAWRRLEVVQAHGVPGDSISWSRLKMT